MMENDRIVVERSLMGDEHAAFIRAENRTSIGAVHLTPEETHQVIAGLERTLLPDIRKGDVVKVADHTPEFGLGEHLAVREGPDDDGDIYAHVLGEAPGMGAYVAADVVQLVLRPGA